MTNSPFGISLDGLLADLLSGESKFPGMFTTTTVTTETPTPKLLHKKVSELSVGNVLMSPTGVELKITNISLIEDDLVELVFHTGDAVEVWPNAMLEVK